MPEYRIRSTGEVLSDEEFRKLDKSHWSMDEDDENIIIRNSEILCGVMDKTQFGAKNQGKKLQ